MEATTMTQGESNPPHIQRIAELSDKINALLARVKDACTREKIRAFIKKFLVDFGKFLVFDAISAVLISLVVIHFAIPH